MDSIFLHDHEIKHLKLRNRVTLIRPIRDLAAPVPWATGERLWVQEMGAYGDYTCVYHADKEYGTHDHRLRFRWKPVPFLFSRFTVTVEKTVIGWRLGYVDNATAVDAGILRSIPRLWPHPYWKRNFPVYAAAYDEWKKQQESSPVPIKPPLGPEPIDHFRAWWASTYGRAARYAMMDAYVWKIPLVAGLKWNSIEVMQEGERHENA